MQQKQNKQTYQTGGFPCWNIDPLHTTTHTHTLIHTLTHTFSGRTSKKWIKRRKKHFPRCTKGRWSDNYDVYLALGTETGASERFLNCPNVTYYQ